MSCGNLGSKWHNLTSYKKIVFWEFRNLNNTTAQVLGPTMHLLLKLLYQTYWCANFLELVQFKYNDTLSIMKYISTSSYLYRPGQLSLRANFSFMMIAIINLIHMLLIKKNNMYNIWCTNTNNIILFDLPFFFYLLYLRVCMDCLAALHECLLFLVSSTSGEKLRLWPFQSLV